MQIKNKILKIKISPNNLLKLAITALVFLPATAYAGVLDDIFPKDILKKSMPEMLAIIINALLALVGTIAVVFLILGGFQYITSAGNPDNVGKAKNTILYAIIGIIVTIISWSAVKFITDAFK